jgi:hypothetical protein
VRQVGAAVVEQPGESEAKKGPGYRDSGEHQFFGSGFFGLGALRGLFGRALFAHLGLCAFGRKGGPENRTQEVIEVIIAAE